ncbi:hypothetical protein BD770DRAFT_413264 [Pilaira anomala]|nr:hypothetical protein BD770DRAFT_413264 [Pilaira anomala]
MSDNNKWESNSEDLDDEDLVMTEGGDEEDEERYNNSVRSFYPEDFTDQASSMSPQYSRNARDFSRFDLSAGSPLGWNEAIDEKGEAVTLMMHLEKTIVHQKFFNSKFDI